MPSVRSQTGRSHARKTPLRVKPAFAHFTAVEAALGRILPMTQPADVVLSSYFRTHHELGQHDRQFIAETVFGYCDGALDLNTKPALIQPVDWCLPI